MRSIEVVERSWSGVRLDVTGFHCSGQVVHQLRHADKTRLSVVLEEVGGSCEPRLRPNKPNPIDHIQRHMHFAPKGLELWGYAAQARFVRDATLSFDLKWLSEAVDLNLSEDSLLSPRLRFADDRLWTLVRMLAEVVNDPDPSSQLYGDGLTMAIAARLFALSSDTDRRAQNGLAPWRLRRVIDYLDAHLPRRVELAQLAELAGLSPAHFSREFKVSTGLSPYQWQLDARIRAAQAQLVDTDASLEQVAAATGFADAVHFGRTFRKMTGASPAVWRNDRKV